MKNTQSLEHLLREIRNTTEMECLAAIRDGLRESHVTRPIPLKDVLDTYRFGSPIDGFEDLLVNLGAWPEASVVAQTVETPGSTQAAGVLKIPVQTSTGKALATKRTLITSQKD